MCFVFHLSGGARKTEAREEKDRGQAEEDGGRTQAATENTTRGDREKSQS